MTTTYGNRRCSKCKLMVAAELFPPSVHTSAKAWAMCNPCRNAYYRGRRRVRPSGYFAKYVRARRERNAEWVARYKAERGCMTCGESHPAALDFHHRDPKEKSFNLAAMVGGQKPIKLLEKEAAKCDVICSNCHRKLHDKEGRSHWRQDTPGRRQRFAEIAAEKGDDRAARGIHIKRLNQWQGATLTRFLGVS